MVEGDVSLSVEGIARALVNIYKGNVDIDHEVEENLFQETRQIFNEAITEGYANATEKDIPLPNDTFNNSFQNSADVFSAFRVHRMQQDIAAQMIGDDGQLKPFSKFVKDVSPYIEHRNRAWLRTEYNTAILRAQNAAEWKMFEAEKDVYPNLEWIESTSPNPGADHRVFWGTVRPVDDPFWNEHKPGDRWNCKCELQQSDSNVTATPTSDGKSDPARGLESNPAKSEELFSDKHPYYPKSCVSCPFAGNKLMALAMDLAGRKNCNRCGKVSKSVERSRRNIEKRAQKESFSKKNNPKEFYIEQAKLLEYLRKKGKYIRNSRKLYTSHLYFGRHDFKNIKGHCFNGLELEVAQHLHSLLPKIKNGKYLPIDMSRRNYRRKMKDGMLNFTAYDIEYKGTSFVLKCQVRRDGSNVCEYPYSVKQKE